MKTVLYDSKGKIRLVLMRGSWCRPIRNEEGLIVEFEPVEDQAAAKREATQ